MIGALAIAHDPMHRLDPHARLASPSSSINADWWPTFDYSLTQRVWLEERVVEVCENRYQPGTARPLNARYLWSCSIVDPAIGERSVAGAPGGDAISKCHLTRDVRLGRFPDLLTNRL